MVVLQNNETSAPVTLKSASFHLLKNIKSPVKEKNSHDKEWLIWTICQMCLVCSHAPYANMNFQYCMKTQVRSIDFGHHSAWRVRNVKMKMNFSPQKCWYKLWNKSKNFVYHAFLWKRLYTGIERSHALINNPSPMTKNNNYQKLAKR